MIQVKVEPCGAMREYFPDPVLEFRLPDGARLGDLLDGIDAEHGERLAGTVWNQARRRFRGPVVIKAGSRVLTARDAPLRDGQVVSLFKALVGG
jgi:hypothetical protein